MRVWDVCTHEAIDIAPDASLAQAAEAMRRHQVGLLVACVRNDGSRTVVGVITDRDIVVSAVASGRPLAGITVASLMRAPVEVVRDDADVFEAIMTMRHHGIRRLPVCNALGRLVGVLSADDVWEGLSHQLSALAEVLVQGQTVEMRAHR